VVTKLTMSAPSGRVLSPISALSSRFPVPPVRTSRGGALLESPAVVGSSTNLVTNDSLAVIPAGRGRIFDWRSVIRPRQQGVAVGRFERTKIPGTVSFAVKASGFSASCQSRFVRLALVNVVVIDRD
jgi:hypothetical protein